MPITPNNSGPTDADVIGTSGQRAVVVLCRPFLNTTTAVDVLGWESRLHSKAMLEVLRETSSRWPIKPGRGDYRPSGPPIPVTVNSSESVRHRRDARWRRQSDRDVRTCPPPFLEFGDENTKTPAGPNHSRHSRQPERRNGPFWPDSERRRRKVQTQCHTQEGRTAPPATSVSTSRTSNSTTLASGGGRTKRVADPAAMRPKLIGAKHRPISVLSRRRCVATSRKRLRPIRTMAANDVGSGHRLLRQGREPKSEAHKEMKPLKLTASEKAVPRRVPQGANRRANQGLRRPVRSSWNRRQAAQFPKTLSGAATSEGRVAC